MKTETWYANVYRNDQPKENPYLLYVGTPFRTKREAEITVWEKYKFLKTISIEIPSEESNSKEEDIYYCDGCEEPIHHNEESHEVRYGFICQKCSEHF